MNRVLQRAFASRACVNALYQPGVRVPPVPGAQAQCSRSPCVCRQPADRQAALQAHAPRDWPRDELAKAAREHVLMTWGATDPMLDSVRPVVCPTICRFFFVFFLSFFCCLFFLVRLC